MKTVETMTIDGIIRSQEIRWSAPMQASSFHRCLLMVANQYDQGQLCRTEVIKYRADDGWPESHIVYGPPRFDGPRKILDRSTFASPFNMLYRVSFSDEERARLPYFP